MSLEKLCVKTETGEVCVKEEAEEECDNEETGAHLKEKAECEDSAGLNELYADHQIKHELVLGPMELHRPCVASTLPECFNPHESPVVSERPLTAGAEPAQEPRRRQLAQKKCSVRLERVPHCGLRARARGSDRDTPATRARADSDSEDETYSTVDYEKDPICDLCRRRFALKSDLMNHVAVHIYEEGVADDDYESDANVERRPTGVDCLGHQVVLIRHWSYTTNVWDPAGPRGSCRPPPSTHQIYIGTLNVRSLVGIGRQEELENAIQNIKWDIIGLSEIKKLGINITEYGNYIMLYTGSKSGRKGVGFIVKQDLKNNIINFDTISDRVARLDLKFGHSTISIIQVYAPTDKASDEEIERFYYEIRCALNNTLVATLSYEDVKDDKTY